MPIDLTSPNLEVMEVSTSLAKYPDEALLWNWLCPSPMLIPKLSFLGPVGVAGGKLLLLNSPELRSSTEIDKLLGSGGVKDSCGVCGECLSAVLRMATGLGAGRESDREREFSHASNKG